MHVDIDTVNATAIHHLESLLCEWLPNGRKNGNEWQVGDWDGNPGKSLSINIKTAKGNDFATNEPVGDVIGICAKVFKINRIEAAKKIADRLGIGKKNTAPGDTFNGTCQEHEKTDAEKQNKLNKIVSELVNLPGTPAVLYLKSRGIKGAPLNLFKFRPNKNGGGGALVCIAKNDTGEIKAVQSIYINDKGQKANLHVKKRTNGFPAGNPIKIKGDPQGPILLTEGPEDALTLAQTTGMEVWCSMGLNFIDKIDEPKGRALIIVRDNDEPDSDADKTMNKILSKFLDRGFSRLLCARPPMSIKDSNQLLQELGPDAVVKMINEAQAVQDARNSNPEPPAEHYEPIPDYPDIPEYNIFSELAYLPRTDVGNSQRIVKRWGKIVKFVPGMGWIIYHNGLWDNKHSDLRVINMAKRTALDIIQETEYVEEHQKSGIKNWCKKSQEGSRINYALRLAQPDLCVDADKLDKERMYFNCANGVIDLTTGKLMKHSSEFYCTKQSPVIFETSAKCPAWQKFLKEILVNEDMINFVQRAIGYSLSGDIREQCMFVLYGKGANGKSTFLETIQSLIGDYHIKTKADAFMESGRITDANPFIAMLRSARFVTASETKADRALDESLIKEATSDTTMTARNLHQNPFQFSPQFKLWLATNHKPEIRGTDDGIWRRLVLIPFNIQFYDKSDPDAPAEGPFKDKMLIAKLKNELPGILNWAIKGCLEWQRQGLNPPDIIREATQEYRTEMDVLGTYLEENTIRMLTATISCADLYENYKRWCQDAGHTPYSKNKLGRRLYERHISKGTTTKGEKAYVGIKLRETWTGFNKVWEV
jgi:P4 family phage/plasmid primase-like protien